MGQLAPDQCTQRAVLLDASALLAVIQREPGAEVVAALLRHAHITSVNLSEVIAQLTRKARSEDEIIATMKDFALRVMVFDEVLAMKAGRLIAATQVRGLSFGDRACMAAGLLYDLPVVTADRSWVGLVPGLEVVAVR